MNDTYTDTRSAFDAALADAAAGRIDRESALLILEQSRAPEKALRLFAAASAVRDRHLGRELWWSAGPSAVIPCKIVPRCTYCTFYARHRFTREHLEAAARAVAGRGIRYFILSGGTSLAGYDDRLVDMVRTVQEAADLDIFVNLGPSLTEETVATLKAMGVAAVTSSLEVHDEAVFARVKPADSLPARKALLEACERQGMPIRTMILLGLGETDRQRVEHLFYLRDFRCLSILNVSRYYPYPGVDCAGNRRCSPWEMARVVALARLLLPAVDIGFGAGHTPDDIPLWFLAGGGNKLVGSVIAMRSERPAPQPMEEIVALGGDLYEINRMPIIGHYLDSLGVAAGFARQTGGGNAQASSF